MIVAPFGVGYSGGGFTTHATPPKSTDTYGTSGSATVHYVLSEILQEVVLVLLLSAASAHGGGFGKIATAIMIGVLVLWASNYFSQGGKL